MSVDDRLPPWETDETATPIVDHPSSTDLPISISDFLQLMANARTRYALYLLTARGGTVFLAELEEYFEDDKARTMLHHHHLPRLIDFHIIDYEPDSGAITLTPIGDDLRPAIETIKSMEADAATAFLEQTNR
jgi:hypothetical protein